MSAIWAVDALLIAGVVALVAAALALGVWVGVVESFPEYEDEVS